MLNTLRQRLILSHVLPLLVIVPVMGIALIYVLETRVLLADLASELTAEAALVAELTQSQCLEQSRRQLLANLVHELGRPLGALRSAVQAMLGGADGDAALRHDLLTGMEEEMGRLQRLLDNLARLHDQVLGTLELDRQRVALNRWLSFVLAPWREAAQRKGLRWETIIPADLPTLEADPDRLSSALGNLLSNAIKYTPPEGAISIEADVEPEAVWIRVSDTGPGIPLEEQAYIFTPFYHGCSVGRFPQGMGLGLTIARDLAVAHGGRLEVESTPGQGSRFTLRIPLASPNQG